MNPAAESHAPLGRESRFLDRFTPPALITLILASGLGPLSMNIFLPSMPSMAAWFDTEYSVIQLAVSAYLAVMAAVQLVIGPLSDRYGRRPVLLGSFAVFTLATLGSLAAPNVESFLLCRMAQAVAAAGIVLSRAMARDIVGPDGAASMIGYVTMGMAVAPMLGPMIGGVLEESFGWQANFVALLVFGLVAWALTWADAGETNDKRSASFRAQMATYPALFGSRRFWGYAACAAFASGAFFAFLGGAPYVGTEVLGMDASELGLHFGMIAGGYMAGNFLSGRYSVRVGMNRMILTGTLVAAGAMGLSTLLFLGGALHPMALFAPVFFVGLGNGLTMPNATAGTLSVRPHLAGSASGLGSTLMVGGGALMATATGALLGPGATAIPLVGMMFASSVCAVLATFYVLHVERVRGPLGEGRPQPL